MGADDIRLNADTANQLATNLAKLIEAARFRVADTHDDPLVSRLVEHLGRSLLDVPTVTENFGAWEHVNLQRALDAYLAAHSPDAEWFGIAGSGRHHQELVDMITDAALRGNYQLGAVDYRTVATGPDSATEVVTLGLVNSYAPEGAPVLLAVRGPNESRGNRQSALHIIAPDRATATTVIDGIDADADVTFVLTTNRVEILEKALTDRPGRVDLALEIPKPGPVERERLLRLYTRTVDLDLPDSSELIAELDGVTPRSCANWCAGRCCANWTRTPTGHGFGSMRTRCVTPFAS
jgi:hypothetical protein